jgi:hypothetical protein
MNFPFLTKNIFQKRFLSDFLLNTLPAAGPGEKREALAVDTGGFPGL